MDIQNFKNANHRFPVSTDALDFMQNQIFLAAKLASVAGTNVIITPATTTKDGLVVIDGELLPLQKGIAKRYINIVETPESITAGTITFDNVRIRRVAQYATTGYAVSRFTTIDSIVSLMTRIDTAVSNHNSLAARVTTIENNYKTATQINDLLDANAQHHLPKGSIIDWYGTINPETLAYGYLPCGTLKYNTLALAQAAKSKWETRYPGIVVTQWYEGGAYYYVKITNYQGTVIPDLTDRFIVQAGKNYSLGDIGGESKHRLSIDEIPAHRHVYNADSNGINRNTYAGMGTEESGSLGDYSASGSGAGGRAYSSYAGAGCGADGKGSNSSSLTTTSHENRPPYYALYKLIKVI